MKKALLIALVIALICLTTTGCTPEDRNEGSTAASIVSPVEPEGKNSEEASLNQTEAPASAVHADHTTSTLESEHGSPIPETEEPEEEIPDTYVIDVGEGVGVGGN